MGMNLNENPGMRKILTYTKDVSADETAIAAPGAGKRIVITGVGFTVTNGADELITIEDANTTAVHILTFAADDEGMSAYFPVNIPCTTNKAISINMVTAQPSGTANIIINYYIDKLAN